MVQDGCVMATFSISATADDVYRRWGSDTGETFSSSGDLYAGSWDLQIVDPWWAVEETALRFTNITIPPGSVIISASIHIKTPNTGLERDTANLDIQACDEDSSSQITSFNDFGSRARTTASVLWTQDFADNTEYDTPEIKTVIQEIIDRPGWSSGNSLQIIWSDHTYKYPDHPPGTGYTAPYGIFLEDSDFNISLSVTYTFTTDIGLRIRTSSETVNVGVQDLKSTHKLRIRKGATTYGIPLLSTADSNAIGLRIYDGSLAKALPKIVSG